VEVRAVGDSAFPWTAYSTDYEFLAPTSWSGEVFHRGAARPLEPGAVLCARPGELVTARSVRVAGARCSLVVEAHTLAEFLDEHRRRERRVEVVPRAHMSPALQTTLAAVFLGFRTSSGALELQGALVEFFARAVPELFGQKSEEPMRATAAPKAAARMRELLEESSADTIDLATLAREVGLSRFGALRAFKRQFGLPPHAYHLSMRLGLARRSLRRGLRPAEVAAEYGFVDQSHLTRHFRRVFGIPPAEYTRGDVAMAEAARSARRANPRDVEPNAGRPRF
jgi:AraC-like DNA-binding protein